MTVATTSSTIRARSSDRRRARILRRLPWWLAALFLAGACFLWIYPFLWMLSAALKSTEEIFKEGLNIIPSNFRWENYARAWRTAHFGTYLQNTVIVTAVSVFLIVFRSAMAGYVLARYKFRGKKIVIGTLIATIFVPVGYTIIPVVDISQKLHLLNSLGGMILALSGGAHVAMILLYMGYFYRMPREIYESALVDGAGFFTLFFRIMLPLANPVTATAILLTFLNIWNAYFLPLVFTFSRPKLRTVSVGMEAFSGEYSTDWPGMAAGAVISLTPVVILFFVLQRYFVEGIAGAVKQ